VVPEPARALLHGDYQPAHVLVVDGTVSAIIDWGDAATGDPLWDVAVLTAHDPQRLPPVLAAIGGRPGDAELVEAYWVVRHLGSATWMADHGFDPSRDLRAATTLSGP
jgi:aminoglycoside phosphotransferase (APT) family kinase protein